VFTALLDTCVLWPSLQRDFLLSLAVVGLYRPVWSSAILDELQYHEEHKLIKHGTPADEASQRSQRLITQMRRAFNDAEVEGWEALEGTFGLPDEDDEHVVAAAVVGGAGVIVTSNISDFPAKAVPPAIQVVKRVWLRPDREVVQRRHRQPIALRHIPSGAHARNPMRTTPRCRSPRESPLLLGCHVLGSHHGQ